MKGYPQQLLQYFYHLEHAGELTAAPIYVMEQGTVEQGDIVRFYVKLENQRIIQARFKAYGSVAIIAGGEYVCRWLEGKNIQEAAEIQASQILTALGLSSLKNHTAVLLTQCVGKLIQRMYADAKK